jgi:hypothetical protein
VTSRTGGGGMAELKSKQTLMRSPRRYHLSKTLLSGAKQWTKQLIFQLK